jgi:hypothetical protein
MPSERAQALGWSHPDLFNVPALWSQIRLTGAAWLIGERNVVAIDAAAISIELTRITLWRQADGSIEKRPEIYRQRIYRSDELRHVVVTPVPSVEPPPVAGLPPRDPVDEEAAIARFKAAAEVVFGTGIEIIEDGGERP